MRLLVIGNDDRFEKFLPELEVVGKVQCTGVPRGTPDDEIIAAASDAEIILADAIQPVSEKLISALPNLKLIHSEGVAYNAIDLDAARRRGVVVCNCKGANAEPVAEQAVLLMLACLRDVVNGDAAVRDGRQIQTKERLMVEGIRELSECKVGFVGAGDTAQATMMRLANWGCEMAYFKRSRLSLEKEETLGAHFEPLDELLASSDIISLHVPVTDDTINMVNDAFLAAMKPGSILINTARGEIVDSRALGDALVSGHLSAAGLDTLYPEPVTVDNILLNLPGDASKRVVFSPHVAGITTGTFHRIHQIVWGNIARVMAGEQPINIVS